MPEAALLHHHQLAHRQALRDEHGDQQRKRDGNFVADHLRRAAHRAVERPLVVGRPARHENADDRQRRHRHDVEDADVDVGRDQVLRPRQHGEGRERRGEHDVGRELEQRLVRRRRRDVFLQQQFHGVGGGLVPAVPAVFHRPQAVLEVRRNLAFQPDGQQREHGHEADDAHGKDGGNQIGIQSHRSTSPSTTSSEPTSATMSAMNSPGAMRGITDSTVKDGARHFRR